MKYIGIDYGTKKTGIAISDPLGTLAFPREVLVTDKSLLKTIADLIIAEEIGGVVVGESLNLQGGLNKVAAKAGEFANRLKTFIGSDIKVSFEDERFSTQQARALPNEQMARGTLSNKRKGANKSTGLADAQAAAIILQSFLDKQRHVG